MNTLKQASGFAAGTFVHTAEGWTPIQDVKVGDMVLSKPENGEGEASYKPVLNTFAYENKELWLVVAQKHWSSRDIHDKRIDREIFKYTLDSPQFLATPNHPVWVVGMGVWDGRMNLESIIPYPQPQWKRVDQLQQYEIVTNKDGVLFYIERAQPLFNIEVSQTTLFKHDNHEIMQMKPSYAWYQDNYYITKDKEDYDQYDMEDGLVIDIANYYETNRTGLYVKNTKGGAGHYNLSKDENGHYYPFIDTVYDLEVADYSTYCITKSGVYVHNLKILKV